MKIIGNNLLMLRESLDLLQAEVSDGIVTPDYIRKIESGIRTGASQKVVKSLAMKLCTTEEWLTKNTGWAYNPSTPLKALTFITRQIEKFKSASIIIISDRRTMYSIPEGFVFIRPNGTISVNVSQVLLLESYGESVIYKEVLKMIKETQIITGHVEINETERKYLIHTDLSTFAKQANYDVQTDMNDKYDVQTAKKVPREPSRFSFVSNMRDIDTPPKDSSDGLTENEKTLLKIIRTSEMDIPALITFIKSLSALKFH